MSDIKPFAFVLMPFNTDFKDIYKYGIKETAENLGIVAERVDEQNFSENILERIYRQIDNCDFVIADMTGQNPNVFYEVGYAHAKSKLCTLITQDASDIPFDLKHHTHLIYDGSIDDLKQKLNPKLQWLKEVCEKQKNDTLGPSINHGLGNLEKDEYTHTGDFVLALNFKNSTNERSPELEAIFLTTHKSWRLFVDGKECPYEPSSPENTKRNVITPPIRHLSPGEFSQVKIEFKRPLWRKFLGDVIKDEYIITGTLRCEIVTSEESFFYDFPLQVEFNEIPF